MSRILIVEDEESIRKFIKISLKREKFQVFEAASAEEGIQKILQETPDVLILDVMLPGMNGFELCEKLKKQNENIGIIILTARGQDMDKIMGLEFGADDYMVKPFNPLELIARINSLLRRMKYKNNEGSNFINSREFKIDLYSKKIFKNDIELDLTPKEFLLMKMFIQNPSKALSRDELLNSIWGYEFIGDTKIVDVNIRRLRSKVEKDPSDPQYIETVWGTGYRWGAS
ncbi:response regulator transcription factor [Clostridium tagluense]|uniref:response regulator transcription factor n=1 Tax=Clostridium TaxID=1485 RepID=UPI0013E97203|nr:MULTISPECIES: response regulator transcription factor [Clostridium]MBU3127786.1 response regulator transcription factor [Clostridium tagluense]MBW9157438.1 response regulator transcription factor [Clostridium tagluense]MBZ9622388.1 response regulator transcription factor [Clostridium sp. FP2]MBZ9633946.1 response regulator transcription factor [Clostridium sp. FP1]MCB2299126.1 response regulator transcription factor [Clostridium tagluense]